MYKKALPNFIIILVVSLLSSCGNISKPTFKIKVEVEEKVDEYESADNGSGPMWCHGNTCIVRNGEQVVASGLETLKDVESLNNTRWILFERTDKGWGLVMKDEKDSTREPCPIGITNDGKILLSVNPTIKKQEVFMVLLNPGYCNLMLTIFRQAMKHLCLFGKGNQNLQSILTGVLQSMVRQKS